MEPKDPAKAPEPGTGARSQEPDEPEETEEILKDAFGNEAEHLWWVPMEFVHEYEDGGKTRFTFNLKVAGRDEEDARDTAEGITIDDIVDDNPDFDGLGPAEIAKALDKCDSVCEVNWDGTVPDDADTCPLRVDNESDVEECFD